MINCNECFLAGTEVCKNKLSTCTIPATTDKCEYFITLEDAKEKIIHEKELPKIMKENAIRDAKEREKRLRKEILSERFRLNQYYDEPWRFSIVNRFTDEQIQDFINNEYIPSTHFPYEDDMYEYNKSKEELINYMAKYLQKYLIEQSEEIVEINDKMFKARTKLDEIMR